MRTSTVKLGDITSFPTVEQVDSQSNDLLIEDLTVNNTNYYGIFRVIRSERQNPGLLAVLVPTAGIEQAQRTLIGILILALLAWLGWLGFPFLRKSVARTRRRNRALDLGPRARVALAYADWRDWATDYGYAYAADTPLMFVQRFPEDEEHREFAWLVTRCLWGDMQEEIDEHIAASCEELSRSLRRRLAAAHPGAVRFVAAFSRLSQRNPYSPSLHRILGRQAEESTRKEVQVVPVTA